MKQNHHNKNSPNPPRKIAPSPKVDPATFIRSIRWMIRRDLPEVVNIENHSFEHPQTEDEIISILQCRSTIGMVAEIDGVIVGYMIYELFRTNIQLLTIAVHEDYRRRGIGQAMVEKLKGKVRDSKKRDRLTLDIRERNLPGQLFFREQGFRAVEVLERFWDFGDGTFEDSYWMEWVSSRCSHTEDVVGVEKPRETREPREPGSWKGVNRLTKYLAGG